MRRLNQARKEEAANPLEQLTAALQSLSPPPDLRPVYLAPTRRCERFSRHPRSSADMSAQDWVTDVPAILKSRRMSPYEEAAFVIEHLSGRARQEVLGRGETGNAEKIFEVLLNVFDDGASLRQLKSKFYSYQQKPSEDILACSLELHTLYQRTQEGWPAFEGWQCTSIKEIIDVHIANVTSRTLVIPPKAIICEIQPVTIEDHKKEDYLAEDIEENIFDQI